MRDDYSSAAVWRIAAPMILSNVSIPLLGMVDTAVMGHLSAPYYLGAVAVGATIFNMLFLALNFLRMGTTGITAQVHGSGDADEMRTVLAQGLITAQGLALALLLFHGPLGSIAIDLIGPSTQVAGYASQYFSVRIWGAPATLANYAMLGWFLGMQNARAPLALLLTINSVNIGLDLLFVLVLGMDVEGVALASVIAESVGLFMGLWLVRRELRRWPGHWLIKRILDGARFARLFEVNSNLFVRTLTLMFAFAFLTAQGARISDIVLATNALLLTFQSFMAYGLDGFAHAAEALIGKAIGRRDREGFRQAFRHSLIFSGVFAIGFSLLIAIAGMPVARLITDLPDVLATVEVYLPWMIVSPLLSVWCFFYDGVYVGATRAREMRDTMLVSCFLVYLPTWYLLQPMGNHGLWAAFMVFMAARGLTMEVLYRRLERGQGFVADLGPVIGPADRD